MFVHLLLVYAKTVDFQNFYWDQVVFCGNIYELGQMPLPTKLTNIPNPTVSSGSFWIEWPDLPILGLHSVTPSMFIDHDLAKIINENCGLLQRQRYEAGNLGLFFIQFSVIWLFQKYYLLIIFHTSWQNWTVANGCFCSISLSPIYIWNWILLFQL